MVSNDYERTRYADEERSFVVFFGEAAKPAQMMLRDHEKICRSIRCDPEGFLGVPATPKAGVAARSSASDFYLQPQQFQVRYRAAFVVSSNGKYSREHLGMSEYSGKKLGGCRRRANVKKRHPGIEIHGQVNRVIYRSVRLVRQIG